MPMRDMKESGIVGRGDVFKIDPRKIIVREGWNKRTEFDLDDLKESIRQNGVKVPLRVKRNKNMAFELVDGERRLRSVMALINEGCPILWVPCLAEDKKTPDDELMINAILANQGKPFTPFEESETFRQFLAWGWDIAKLAKRMGRSHEYIRSRLSLLNAEPAVVEAVQRGELPITQAVSVVRTSQRNGASQTETLAATREARASKREQPKVTRTESELTQLKHSNTVMLEALRALKLRIGFIGIPGEPRRADGSVDWEQEIALLEQALAIAEGR